LLPNLFAVCRQCHDIVELRPRPKTVEDRIMQFSTGNYWDFIYCECGCGFTRSKYNEKGKVMKFINGHQNRGVNNPFYGKTQDEIKSSKKLQQEYIECACGCEKIKPKYDKWGRSSKYIEGHNNRGKTGLKGRFYIDKYKHILKPDHHFADSKGYVAEHRLVYEEYYKCCLLSDGVIHHVNGNKLDNRIENLEGMTKTQHKILHGKEFNRFENYHKKSEFITNQFGTFKKKVFRV